MPANNIIYSKLVTDEGDLIGHVAYSLYQKSKIEYIAANAQNNFAANAEQFALIASTSDSITRYRMQGEIILQNFINEVLSGETEQIRQEFLMQQTTNLKKVLKPYKPKFWPNVWAGIVSALLLAITLAVIGFIIQNQNAKIELKVSPPVEKP